MRSRLFALNEPNALRLSPVLALEIGLNESLLLLQLEYWISIGDNERDGRLWTYQSVRDIQEKAFPFWSTSTIQRTLNALIDAGYLIEGNYNTKKYDFTRWFALGDNLAQLRSIRLEKAVDTRSGQNDEGSPQDGTGCGQNDTRSPQNVTPIPESTQESTTETTTEIGYAPRRARGSMMDCTPEYLAFYESYPRKIAKRDGWNAWKARLRDIENPVTAAELQTAAKNYAEVCRIQGTPSNYAMYPATFLGPNLRYLDYLDPSCIEGAKKSVAANRSRNQYTYQHDTDPERAKENDDWWERIAKR